MAKMYQKGGWINQRGDVRTDIIQLTNHYFIKCKSLDTRLDSSVSIHILTSTY